MKTKTEISTLDRLDRIKDFVDARQRVVVSDLVAEFAISETTARRDLEVLAERGSIQRVHGGAIALRKAPPEPPALLRAGEQADEKQRIGRAAAGLIDEGDTVFLGAGTTVMEVARHVHDRRRLTVITNSLLVFQVLADAPDLNLVGLGGLFRKGERSFVGDITEQALERVRAAKVFLGVRALDVNEGLTEEYPPEAATNRQIVKSGRHVIVVADHTKFGRVAGSVIAPVTAMHTLVTDGDAPSADVEALTAKGIRVVRA